MHNTYTSSTKSSMLDNSGFCTKRRSPSCTGQTTRSTADHKIVESFNCFRHHEAKRQAHLSGNYELFRPTQKECLCDSSTRGSRCRRSFWTEINRLEPRAPEKQDGDQVVVSGKLIIREFQLLLCLFAKLLDNIYVSTRGCYFHIRTSEDWPRESFFLGTLEFVYFAGFVAKRIFFVVIWWLATKSCTRERFNRIVGTTRDIFHGKVSKLCHKLSSYHAAGVKVYMESFFEFHSSSDNSWSVHVIILCCLYQAVK